MIHWVSLTQYFLSLGRDNRLIRGTEEYKGSQLVKTDTFGMVGRPVIQSRSEFWRVGNSTFKGEWQNISGGRGAYKLTELLNAVNTLTSPSKEDNISVKVQNQQKGAFKYRNMVKINQGEMRLRFCKRQIRICTLHFSNTNDTTMSWQLQLTVNIPLKVTQVNIFNTFQQFVATKNFFFKPKHKQLGISSCVCCNQKQVF